MRISEILTPSFRELRQELGLPRPAKAVVQVSADSDFCREVVARGWLTEEQMAHAAERYRLGRSKSGRCIVSVRILVQNLYILSENEDFKSL